MALSRTPLRRPGEPAETAAVPRRSQDDPRKPKGILLIRMARPMVTVCSRYRQLAVVRRCDESYDVSTLVGATEGKKAQANPAVTLDSRQRARAKAKRDALVADHIDLVPPIARSVLNNLPPSFELDDLIATGNLALVDAAGRFRPSEHGCAPFSAYARQRIRGAILDSIKRRHYRNATLEPAEAAQEPARGPVIETEIDNGRLRERVQDAITWLPEREQRILREYYSPAEPDLRAVGAVLEISRSKAKQLHLDGIRHLRERLRVTGALQSVA